MNALAWCALAGLALGCSSGSTSTAAQGDAADADGASCLDVPVPDGEVACRLNADCPADRFCGSCLGCTGYCLTRSPPKCYAVIVCGCDGAVFPNNCAAATAGVATSIELCH